MVPVPIKFQPPHVGTAPPRLSRRARPIPPQSPPAPPAALGPKPPPRAKPPPVTHGTNPARTQKTARTDAAPSSPDPESSPAASDTAPLAHPKPPAASA